MKKILFIVIVTLFSVNVGFSQALNSIGEKQLNFGLRNHGVNGSRFNGIYIGFDYMTVKDLSIGANVDLNHWNNSYYSMTILTPSFIVDYHFNNLIGIPSQFDFYAGADLGLPLYFGNGTSGTGDFNLGTHVGGRWYWNDKWGINLELGLGILSGGNGAKFGLSMKL